MPLNGLAFPATAPQALLLPERERERVERFFGEDGGPNFGSAAAAWHLALGQLKNELKTTNKKLFPPLLDVCLLDRESDNLDSARHWFYSLYDWIAVLPMMLFGCCRMAVRGSRGSPWIARRGQMYFAARASRHFFSKTLRGIPASWQRAGPRVFEFLLFVVFSR